MSTFKNSFAVLKEINDKKKTIVITDKPKAKKPVKVAKPAVVAETTAPAVVSAPAAKGAKAAPAKAAAPAPVVNAPPKNSLAELKEQIKRAKAEEAAKAAAPKVEEVVEAPAVEAPVAEEAVAVEGEVAAAEGEAVAAEGEAVAAEVPVPEAPKLTLAEFQKLREERLFVVKKEARRVDPTSITGFVALNAEPAKPVVKKVEPAKPVAPVKAPAKGAKATALPTPAPAPKAVPKEKKEKTLSLGEFVAQAPAGRNFRPRRFNNDKAAAGFNAEDAKQFPSL